VLYFCDPLVVVVERRSVLAQGSNHDVVGVVTEVIDKRGDPISIRYKLSIRSESFYSEFEQSIFEIIELIDLVLKIY